MSVTNTDSIRGAEKGIQTGRLNSKRYFTVCLAVTSYDVVIPESAEACVFLSSKKVYNAFKLFSCIHTIRLMQCVKNAVTVTARSCHYSHIEIPSRQLRT